MPLLNLDQFKKPQLTEPWMLRKIVYCVMALVSIVGVALGAISQAQADAFYAHADELIQAVSVIVLMLAATKTHRGSDSLATDADVSAALHAWPGGEPGGKDA